MRTVELVALAIVVLFIAVRAKLGREPRRFLSRLALLVAASWIGENTVIEAYGFYTYSREWSLFVHHVPLAIVLIWPVVIHSAWELASNLMSGALAPKGEGRRWIPLAVGALVLTDAWMIEPIAVSSGLWWWHEPGIFEVPPIGVLGWAFHAALCIAVLERTARRAALNDAWCTLVAPLGTHVLLLASWWGLFRWINHPVDPWPVVALAWAVSLTLAVISLRRRARRRVPVVDMWLRIPAALFFFTLVVRDGHDNLPLLLYAAAFAPPYLTLTRLSHRTPARAPSA